MAKEMPLEHLKNAKVGPGDGELFWETDVLDGEAKDFPGFNADNETVQYKTPSLPGGAYGGRNDPNG